MPTSVEMQKKCLPIVHFIGPRVRLKCTRQLVEKMKREIEHKTEPDTFTHLHFYHFPIQYSRFFIKIASLQQQLLSIIY